jgi:hypothetical protein
VTKCFGASFQSVGEHGWYRCRLALNRRCDALHAIGYATFAGSDALVVSGIELAPEACLFTPGILARILVVISFHGYIPRQLLSRLMSGNP